MLKKIVKILVIIIIVLLIVIFLAKKNLPELKPMYERIDNSPTIEITISDYYTLKESVFTRYFEFINNKDYNSAYEMLTKDYRAYRTYEEFISEVETKNFSEAVIKSIEFKNNNIYVATVIFGEIEETYFVFVNDITNTFTLAPEGVIEYKKIEKGNIKKENLEAIINNYVVMNDKIIFNITLKNTSEKDNIVINDIEMFSIENFKYNMQNEPITIMPNEEMTENVTYETLYKFPKEIIVKQEGKDEQSYVIPE